MRHSNINLTMSRYTHTLTGQEAQAVAGLPNFSLPGNQKQIATGTDDRIIDTALIGSEKLTPKLTPFLTPTAYSECTLPATVGNQVKNSSKESKSSNCLPDGKLGGEKDKSSSNDTKNGEGGIRTRGRGVYPYDGLANRCLKPLGHLSKQLCSNLPCTSPFCKKITNKPYFSKDAAQNPAEEHPYLTFKYSCSLVS